MAKLFISWLCITLFTLNSVLSNADIQENTFQLEQQIDPVLQGQYGNDVLTGDIEERGDREKRLGIIKKIGLKAGLLDFVFGKIDSFIDSKTRYINELDKQNIIKNQKYFGITPPPRVHPQNNLVGNLINVKKQLLGSAFSSLLQAKLSNIGGQHPVAHPPSVAVSY